MKTRTRVWIWPPIAVSLLSLGACRPIEYYLTHVYKVHGRITVAGSEPPAPIGSVEVRVGGYQYSELTNYYGDYEMELPEGIWTITFSKEGYESQSAEVTVGSGNPRQELDAELVWIAPPFTMTGYWAAYVDFGEGVESPHLIYFVQTGSEYQGWDGEIRFSGEVSGSSVTLRFEMDDEPQVWTGTLEADGQIYGEFWRLEPMDFTHGSFNLHGIVELESIIGLAQQNQDQTWYSLSFGVDVDADSQDGTLIFSHDEMLVAPAVYEMEDWTHAGVFRAGDGWKAEWGTFTLNSFGSSAASGSFDLFEYEDGTGDSLRGTFDLGPGGTGVTITGGTWDDTEIPIGTTPDPVWGTETRVEQGSHNVVHFDGDCYVSLDLTPINMAAMTAGSSYSVPGQVAVNVSWSRDDGTGYEDWEDWAVSGTLVIDDYQEGVGISGHFTDMEFPSGYLSDDFDVSYELNGFE